MNEPFFLQNRIFSGQQGGDAAYMLQNVLGSQGVFKRKPKQLRRPEAQSTASALYQVLREAAEAYDWGTWKEWADKRGHGRASHKAWAEKLERAERNRRRERARNALRLRLGLPQIEDDDFWEESLP